MATSTYFGWAEPDDTDLVKNGASAMRTLGNAIDSSLYTLSGGIAGKNRIINGGFDIWARGTSFAGANSNTYTADRWNMYFGASPTNWTLSRQSVSDSTNLPNIQYCLRVQRNAGATTAGGTIGTSIEILNSIPLAGKQVTLSYYARKGANYSESNSQITYTLKSGTGSTDQNGIYNTYTGQATVSTGTSTLTTTWQRFTYTATVSATATQLALGIDVGYSGTAGAADYVEITGVQLELGSTATPFSRAGGTIQGELAACQRYYYRATAAQNFSQVSSLGTAASTTACLVIPTIKVTLRAIPTVVDYSGLALSPDNANSYVNVNSATISVASPDNPQISLGVASGLTQYRPYYAIAPTAGGYLGIGAEL